MRNWSQGGAVRRLRFFGIGVGWVCAWVLASCNIQFRNKDYRPPAKPKEDAEDAFWKVPRDIEVGEVTFVDDSGFVLLANRKRLGLPVGQKLFVEGQGGKSLVKVSEERSATHLAADVVNGEPQVGDVVVYRHRPGEKGAVGAGETAEGAEGAEGASGGEEISEQPTGLKSVPLDLDEPLPPLL